MVKVVVPVVVQVVVKVKFKTERKMNREKTETTETPEVEIQETEALTSPHFVKVNVAFHFLESGYIGLPFWPERNTLINVSKDVNPRLGDAKKAAALNAALEKRGITPEQYERIIQRASRPFYTSTDADDGSGEIIIPQRIFQSFLNHASMKVPRVIPRIAEKGLTFIGIKVADGFFRTGKTIKDTKVFARFVKMEESNQRSFCESQYIIDFSATGILSVDESIIKSNELQRLCEYAGRYIGIGSARPQGFGRFLVNKWEKI